MPDTCDECGVLDALGRHDPMCGYAIRIGLPRLAEGEVPIAPGEEEEAALAAEPAAEPAAVIKDRPGAIERAPKTSVKLTELWFSYVEADGTFDDALVFGSELDALRHAVGHGAKVQRLELGRSLRAQVDDAP